MVSPLHLITARQPMKLQHQHRRKLKKLSPSKNREHISSHARCFLSWRGDHRSINESGVRVIRPVIQSPRPMEGGTPTDAQGAPTQSGLRPVCTHRTHPDKQRTQQNKHVLDVLYRDSLVSSQPSRITAALRAQSPKHTRTHTCTRPPLSRESKTKALCHPVWRVRRTAV